MRIASQHIINIIMEQNVTDYLLYLIMKQIVTMCCVSNW